MTLCGRYWKQIEATVETTRTWWNIVQNSMERYGMPWKLLVSYRTWARLTPTLTHVVMCNPMTSGAEDGRCHDNSPPPHHLHLPLTTHPHQHLGSPSKLARILNNSHTTDPQRIRVQWWIPLNTLQIQLPQSCSHCALQGLGTTAGRNELTRGTKVQTSRYKFVLYKISVQLAHKSVWGTYMHIHAYH